jgi:GNAT superfamily N-acetyltransferase
MTDPAAGRSAASRVEPYLGDRRRLLPLFALADDSPSQIAAYLHQGEVLVAREAGDIVGHAQLVEGRDPLVLELKSLAVEEAWRGRGIGAALVTAVTERSRLRGARRLLVATAAADLGNLRFYQRRGFRMLRIVRDAFGPESGYPEGLLVDRIPLRDQVWLDLELRPAGGQPRRGAARPRPRAQGRLGFTPEN